MSLLSASDLHTMDAFKIMRMIYTIAKKAKVHRQNCAEFASYLSIISNLLEPIQQSEEIAEHPAVQDALAMLHTYLVKAFLLIQKCEHTSTISALLKRVPNQLKDLEGGIQRTLSLLNLANLQLNLHITTNGSTELNKARLSTHADIHSPTLGVSGSLQEPTIRYSNIATRSVSVPSTSAEGLATSQCLSARSLSITWGNDDRYWKWVELNGSRSREVAYLVEVFWLEVQGQVSLRTLRPGKYTLSWRLQVASMDNDNKPSGWDSEPVIFTLSTNDRQRTERSCFFVERPQKGEIANSETPVVQNGKEEVSGKDEDLGNGWKEYEVGSFTVKKNQTPVELTFSMTEVNGSWKRGLFLDGVIISPCDSPEDEIISSDASSSSSGLQELPTLPDFLFFNGHVHELKLMKDPYWFACDVCEATEQGLGYHCQECKYNVHPECCISDHQFSTLLNLTDSNQSHWHWGNLLELNKHRLDEKASRPKAVIVTGHPHRLKLTQSPHPLFICDAVGCDGHGWVYKGWDGWIYRCEACNFDVHPECRF